MLNWFDRFREKNSRSPNGTYSPDALERSTRHQLPEVPSGNGFTTTDLKDWPDPRRSLFTRGSTKPDRTCRASFISTRRPWSFLPSAISPYFPSMGPTILPDYVFISMALRTTGGVF